MLDHDIVGNAGGGKSISSISDIIISSLADNDILQYDLTGDIWENRTLADAGILKNITDTFTGVLGVIGSINNAPGSDIDTDLITVGVTGTPTFSWDESEDSFDLNKGLLIAGNVGVGTSSPGAHWEISNNTGSIVRLTSSDTTISAANELFGKIEFYSSDGSANSAGVLASIRAESNAAFDGGPTKGVDLVFGTALTDGSGVIDRMSVVANGNVGIGKSVPVGKLHIDQSSITGAKPVLHLDQADLSEEFIKFSSTIGTGNPIEAVAAKTMTPTHFIRVELEGGLVRYLNAGTIA